MDKAISASQALGRIAAKARASLIARLRSQPAKDIGRWIRDELYKDAVHCDRDEKLPTETL